MLRSYLESQGYAVVDTGAARSELAGKGIKRAKEGHTLGPITLSLFYATDFADRFEKQILPALKAGFIVLNDRYIYSLIARAIVRGVEQEWLKEIYGTALKPDVVFQVNGKNHAIEVETGSVYRDKKKFEGKLNLLKNNYGKNWFFVVTDRNLSSKYSRFGDV